jgi:HAD superfamily hydrolase (TIGR01509 family)
MELFYRQALGFKPIYRYASRNTPGLLVTFLQGQGVELELMQLRNTKHEACSCANHIAFHCDDLSATAQRLRNFGATDIAGPRLTGDGFEEINFRDPEGNLVELAKRIHPFKHNPVKGVIFDFDGTLVDSEPNYYEGDRRLMERFGIVFTPEMKRPYVGMGNAEMMRRLKDHYHLSPTVQELLALKNEFYMEVARKDTKAFPEMTALVKSLHERQIPMAVASGSSLQVVDELLELTRLDSYFNTVVSSEEVPLPKPNPDIFIEAARRLSLFPDELVVFEDAPFGVMAAIRAGMRIGAIPTFAEDCLDPAFELADWLVPGGMSEFKSYDALSWIASCQ